MSLYERLQPNATCPGCHEQYYAYPEPDDCEMSCQKCGAEFTYAEGRRGQFFVKEQQAEQRIATLERQVEDLKLTILDIVAGKIRIAGPSQMANEFNFGFDGEEIERNRPYAYRDGACVECGCADGGHYGDCQAVA